MRRDRVFRVGPWARPCGAPVAAWLLLVCSMIFSGLARGAEGSTEIDTRLNGTWTNLASDQGTAEIERGVEQGIEGLFAMGKPTARSRLGAANPPVPTLEIAISEQSIRVNLGHGRNTAAAPGVWQKAKSAAGDPVRIRYSVVAGGVLKMESVTDGGSGRHTFRVSEDGKTLGHDVRVESSRLPHDVRYTLKYRRTQ